MDDPTLQGKVLERRAQSSLIEAQLKHGLSPDAAMWVWACWCSTAPHAQLIAFPSRWPTCMATGSSDLSVLISQAEGLDLPTVNELYKPKTSACKVCSCLLEVRGLCSLSVCSPEEAPEPGLSLLSKALEESGGEQPEEVCWAHGYRALGLDSVPPRGPLLALALF